MLITTFAVALSIATLSATVCFADKSKPAGSATKDDNTVEVPHEILEASAKASLNWVELLDAGKYDDSWEKASSILKLTVKKEQWNIIMEVTRKPLGKVKSRKVLDQRVAKNPNGLPAGDYMVLLYQTDFEKKAAGKELVTLYHADGSWSVLTYQVE